TRVLALLIELTAEADSLQLAKLKVLRLLPAAGLMTPERDHRHRRQAGEARCACGRGTPTIEHISWKCSCPAHHHKEVKTVQASLISIWQHHISDWGDDPTDQAFVQLPSTPPAVGP
ncbi:FCPA, partial [Symbiodinium necroappetens]